MGALRTSSTMEFLGWSILALLELDMPGSCGWGAAERPLNSLGLEKGGLSAGLRGGGGEGVAGDAMLAVMAGDIVGVTGDCTVFDWSLPQPDRSELFDLVSRPGR